ncbi:UNVERIFIED_ORG: acyltransferase [Roseateles sp. XES5]|nr:acyltransferase [Roseateles sp. XES5]
MNARRYEALDSWRGLCACMVALFHFNVFSHIQSAGIVRNAYLFVDFFFVLSGFVIAANYQARLMQGFGPGRFLFLRLGRIYPLHLVTMLLFIPIDIAKDGASPEILHAIVTNALLLQGTGINSALWLNFPSWSISAEFGAYVVFTLITLWLGSRMLPWLVIAVVGAAALVLLSPNRMDSTYDYGLVRCLYGFALGVVSFHLRALFAVLDKPLGRRTDTLIEGAAVVLLCLCLAALDGHSTVAVATPVLFTGMVLLFAREKGRVSDALKVRPMLVIGALSYSIYMVHALVRAVARALAMVLEKTTGLSFFVDLPVLVNGKAPRPLSIDGSLWLGDALQVVMLAATVALAVLTFRYIEEPGRLWSRNARLPALGPASSSA